MSNLVVTRIPPSPTGRLHVGTARTALFNYLYARHHGGQIAFRSEDTDRARSKKEYEDEILEGLTWLGLSWDTFTRQSERGAIYRAELERIVKEGRAYISKEPSKDDPSKEVEVVRLKNPGKVVTFNDLVRGSITFDTTELGDFVIAKSLSEALYHFAVVVDDVAAGVTHVIRGEDHISNTPRQILIQEALGVPRPAYAHLPLILDEKRAKLSKRSGATSVMDYRDEGFLPTALLNYLALLGWHPADDREYFSLRELVDAFTLEGVQKGGASWDRTKLLSVNQHWMRECSDDTYLSELKAGEQWDPVMVRKMLPLLRERAHTFGEARTLLSDEFSYLFMMPHLTRDVLLAKEGSRAGLTVRALREIMSLLRGTTTTLSPEEARARIMPLADSEEMKEKGGRGAVLWPLRYALTGRERSPDPFTLISLLGTPEALNRLQKALAILEE